MKAQSVLIVMTMAFAVSSFAAEKTNQVNAEVTKTVSEGECLSHDQGQRERAVWILPSSDSQEKVSAKSRKTVI